MYFQKFPRLLYQFKFDDNSFKDIVIMDITRNVRFKKEILENIGLYETYDMLDGETPEIVAEKLYGSPYYHWVIMIMNEKYDYLQDFPLSQPELDKYVTQLYGEGNEDDIHHYENSSGFIVDEDDESEPTPVTNREYEDQLNEAKRRIKIISPELLQEVLKQFGTLL